MPAAVAHPAFVRAGRSPKNTMPIENIFDGHGKYFRWVSEFIPPGIEISHLRYSIPGRSSSSSFFFVVRGISRENVTLFSISFFSCTEGRNTTEGLRI